MTIYLYVKTHLDTGLKYLGKTEGKRQDPFRYKGSGKYWIRHIKQHGNNVWTNIVYQSNDSEEIKKMGLYLSNLWNVVESKEWANLKPESGDGGFAGEEPWNKGKQFTEETREKMRNAAFGRTPWNKGKKGVQVAWNKGKTGVQKHSKETRNQMSQSQSMRRNKEKTNASLGKSRFSIQFRHCSNNAGQQSNHNCQSDNALW